MRDSPSSYLLFADLLDQLDLAIDQLVIRDRNFTRFAFVLVDNATELLLHEIAEERSHCLSSEQYRRNHESERLKAAHTLRGTKYRPEPLRDKTQRLILDALGQKFSPKVALARHLELLTETESKAINIFHRYRNTAYHNGQRHDSILHSLAAVYIQATCAILLRYQPNYWSSVTGDAPSHRAMKHLGPLRSGQSTFRSFEGAWKRITELALALDTSPIEDLYNDISKIISDTDEDIEYLASSGRYRNRDEIVIDSQAWGIAFKAEGLIFAHQNGFAELHTPANIDHFKERYPFEYHKDPIPSWRCRAEKIRSCDDPLHALINYDQFMRQTESLRQALSDSAGRHAAYIDSLIHD